jgi:HlyD family secretion protein
MKIQYFAKHIPVALKVSTLVALGLIVGIIPIKMFWQAKPDEGNIVPVAIKPSSTSNPVSALGRIEPKEKIVRLSAPASTQFPRIEKLMVNEGDAVQAGQIIALLDNYSIRVVDRELAEKRVKVAIARLAQVQAGAKTGEIKAQKAILARLKVDLQGEIATQNAVISRFKAEWQNAKSQCDRYQSLYQSGAVALTDRERECLKEKTLSNQLKEATANLNRSVSTGEEQKNEAEATLNRIAEVRPVDVAVAQAEVDEARSAVEAAKSQLELAQVRTPTTGHLLKVHTQPGELVGEWGIADIGQTDQMYIVAEVYETDIGRVRVGQRAVVTSPVIEGRLLGTVEEIGWQLGKRKVLGTDPNLDVDAKVVEVKIRLEPKSSQKVIKLSNLEVQTLIETK